MAILGLERDPEFEEPENFGKSLVEQFYIEKHGATIELYRDNLWDEYTITLKKGNLCAQSSAINPCREQNNQAEFILVKNHDEESCYDLIHRFVAPEFRRKGIATLILKFIVEFLQKSTDIKKISLNTGQIDVCFWAIKNGFIPATNADAEKLKRLKDFLSGKTNGLTIKYTYNGTSKEPYIFKQGDDSSESPYRSFRINFVLDNAIPQTTETTNSLILSHLASAEATT